MRELADGVRLLAQADYRRMRWKNGQGWTTEIAVYPPDARLSGKPFEWRISMAEIEQDGDFSAFAGYDRTILVAEGNGMELSFDAAPAQTLSEPYRPLRFKGEWHTHCRLLHGPVRDFNVMTARAHWQQQCNIVRAAGELAPEPGTETLIVHCLRGSAELRSHTSLNLALHAGETLLCSGAAGMQAFEAELDDAKTVLAQVSLKPVKAD